MKIRSRSFSFTRKGFSHEVIAHAGDSILFLHRFSTEPLGLESKEKFTFLEEIFYLTAAGTIKHLRASLTDKKIWRIPSPSERNLSPTSRTRSHSTIRWNWITAATSSR